MSQAAKNDFRGFAHIRTDFILLVCISLEWLTIFCYFAFFLKQQYEPEQRQLSKLVISHWTKIISLFTLVLDAG